MIESGTKAGEGRNLKLRAFEGAGVELFCLLYVRVSRCFPEGGIVLCRNITDECSTVSSVVRRGGTKADGKLLGCDLDYFRGLRRYTCNYDDIFTVTMPSQQSSGC